MHWQRSDGREELKLHPCTELPSSLNRGSCCVKKGKFAERPTAGVVDLMGGIHGQEGIALLGAIVQTWLDELVTVNPCEVERFARLLVELHGLEHHALCPVADPSTTVLFVRSAKRKRQKRWLEEAIVAPWQGQRGARTEGGAIVRWRWLVRRAGSRPRQRFETQSQRWCLPGLPQPRDPHLPQKRVPTLWTAAWWPR